jgi:hypothetical protein
MGIDKRVSLPGKKGAPLAIKARFKGAQLLPEQLAAGCEFMTNFNEWLFRHSGVRKARTRNDR